MHIKNTLQQKLFPEIVIGNNFYAGTESCITAIGHITLGNNVTLASRVTIIDHLHGRTDYSDVEIPVMQRELSSKGEILIEDNVLIGEGAIILAEGLRSEKIQSLQRMQSLLKISPLIP